MAGETSPLPSWEVWANATESVKAETARVMATTWKCPVNFARHHIDVDRENDRMRAALEFIADRESLTFAECSDAEEIIARAKEALGQ